MIEVKANPFEQKIADQEKAITAFFDKFNQIRNDLADYIERGEAASRYIKESVMQDEILLNPLEYKSVKRDYPEFIKLWAYVNKQAGRLEVLKELRMEFPMLLPKAKRKRNANTKQGI